MASTDSFSVSQFVQEFTAQFPSLDSAVYSYLTSHLPVMEKMVLHHNSNSSSTTAAPKKQRKERKPVDPANPRPSNWQAIWTSNTHGCRAYEPFAEMVATFDANNAGKGRFEINKLIREHVMANGMYSDWQNWTRERLASDGKPIPSDKPVSSMKDAPPVDAPPVVGAPTDPSVSTTTANASMTSNNDMVSEPVLGKMTVAPIPVKPRKLAAK